MFQIELKRSLAPTINNTLESLNCINANFLGFHGQLTASMLVVVGESGLCNVCDLKTDTVNMLVRCELIKYNPGPHPDQR